MYIEEIIQPISIYNTYSINTTTFHVNIFTRWTLLIIFYVFINVHTDINV